ncbi:hypothetical protein HK099_002510, partial [Clydaea vesicula]
LDKNQDFILLKLNVDENPETSHDYQISSLPTVAVFKNGVVVDKFLGLKDAKYFRDFIERNKKV